MKHQRPSLRTTDLPIDFRNRRYPIRYDLSEKNYERKDKILKGLSKDLRTAIQDRVYADFQAVVDADRRLDMNCFDVIQTFRNVPYFHTPNAGSVVLGGSANTLILNAAIPRLIDFGLLVCDFDHNLSLYAYHWTLRGKLLIKRRWPDAKQNLEHPALTSD